MDNQPKIYEYQSINELAERLRDDLNSKDFVLLYAYNGTGKTRLSMAFKDKGKKKNSKSQDNLDKNNDKPHDTLYFNAFTEDLFTWDNDLENDTERTLKINSNSSFFLGFKELELESRIFTYLERYADFNFKIDYENWTISFFQKDDTEEKNIKISRGEENIFIWCIFLAICQLAIDEAEGYEWVKYIYIDDPISSLDDNNAITVAFDLAKLILSDKKRENPEPPSFNQDNATKKKNPIKVVISSHHSLFFNVMCNELKKSKHRKYFLHSRKNELSETIENSYEPKYDKIYSLCTTEDTPFFHHIAMLCELKNAAKTGKIYTYHFNMLRSIMEKTAVFFGYKDFSDCISGSKDETLHARTLNLLSHGRYSIYQPHKMVQDNKDLFCNILNAFIERYHFQLPKINKNNQKDNKDV